MPDRSRAHATVDLLAGNCWAVVGFRLAIVVISTMATIIGALVWRDVSALDTKVEVFATAIGNHTAQLSAMSARQDAADKTTDGLGAQMSTVPRQIEDAVDRGLAPYDQRLNADERHIDALDQRVGQIVYGEGRRDR